jgi:hypothetical protein
VDLLIPEDVVVTDPGESLLGHAIGAAEVAPVRDGNTQIIDITLILIEHVKGYHPFSIRKAGRRFRVHRS